MIKRQNGRTPFITFFQFIKVLWKCRHGNHTPVQMDSDCMYCGLRSDLSGHDPKQYPEWPLKVRHWYLVKRIASHFYYW